MISVRKGPVGIGEVIGVGSTEALQLKTEAKCALNSSAISSGVDTVRLGGLLSALPKVTTAGTLPDLVLRLNIDQNRFGLCRKSESSLS